MASAVPYNPDGFDNPFAESGNGHVAEGGHAYGEPADDNKPFVGDDEGGDFERAVPDSGDVVPTDIDTDVAADFATDNATGATEASTDVAQTATNAAPEASTNTETATNAAPENAVSTEDGSSASPEAGDSESPKKTVKRFLRIRVMAIEPGKTIIYRLEGHTNFPKYRTTHYRDIRRTHSEFVALFEHLNGANAECFVPAVPALPSGSIGNANNSHAAEQARKVMQTWLDRVCGDPILCRDDEMRFFVEADFGYSPNVKRRPPATGLKRKAMKQWAPPLDDNAELRDFRPVVKALYNTGADTVAKYERQCKIERQLALGLAELGHKTQACGDVLNPGAAALKSRDLGPVFAAFGAALVSVSDIAYARAAVQLASFVDPLALVSQTGYVAKEQLTNRHLLMRELETLQQNAKNKHIAAERIKISGQHNPHKVEEAIALYEEATRAETRLSNRLKRISDALCIGKTKLTKNVEEDLSQAVRDVTQRVIECERRTLAVWENIRGDVRAADGARGGLSRLGRKRVGASQAQIRSQGPGGDSWSGDRKVRAEDAEREEDEADLDESRVDAKMAASLLGGSTF
ncbi:Vacuolar protein sorting-associated protein 17 [Yarrowia sp. B02]|nr:Vacuolar protein sorting-associated protein 17 [Yarrowia sp. B02]